MQQLSIFDLKSRITVGDTVCFYDDEENLAIGIPATVTAIDSNGDTQISFDVVLLDTKQSGLVCRSEVQKVWAMRPEKLVLACAIACPIYF